MWISRRVLMAAQRHGLEKCKLWTSKPGWSTTSVQFGPCGRQHTFFTPLAAKTNRAQTLEPRLPGIDAPSLVAGAYVATRANPATRQACVTTPASAREASTPCQLGTSPPVLTRSVLADFAVLDANSLYGMFWSSSRTSQCFGIRSSIGPNVPAKFVPRHCDVRTSCPAVTSPLSQRLMHKMTSSKAVSKVRLDVRSTQDRKLNARPR